MTLPITNVANKHRQREEKTVFFMLEIYCRDQHHHYHGLCPECSELRDYAQRRLLRCVFGDDKPTCAKCTVHCYSKTMREKMRAVMRYSGPRMLCKHPYLALCHLLLDGRRRAPDLQEVVAQRNQHKES